jgi:long-chain acyl-CoA synthetase
MLEMGGREIERIDQKTLRSFDQYTLPQVLAKQAERFGPERIAIREKAYGIWQAYHWQDYLRYTKQAALGFGALGLKRGENIAIITNNHPEWLFSELGAHAIGAITLNLFTSSIAKELVTL